MEVDLTEPEKRLFDLDGNIVTIVYHPNFNIIRKAHKGVCQPNSGDEN